MAWSRLPTLEGIKAAKHWLANLEPSKEARRRKRYRESRQKIEADFQKDNGLAIEFREVIKIARFLGRVDGLREGLELHEYGVRIQEKTTPAFQSAMKYAIRNPDNVSAPEICNYLDEEIRRTEERQKQHRQEFIVKIRPPKDWACKTWSEALKTKRRDVDVFAHKVRHEACDVRYNKLCAWNTWGRKRKEEGDEADTED